MAEITLIEAKEYAKQMANFFKAFRFINETLDHAVAVEELVKAHDIKLQEILDEVAKMEEKKQLLVEDILALEVRVTDEQKDATEKIAAFKAETDQLIQQYQTERQTALDDLLEFKKGCDLSKETAKADLQKAKELLKDEFEEEKERLDSLQKEAEDKLTATEAKLEELRRLVA